MRKLVYQFQVRQRPLPAASHSRHRHRSLENEPVFLFQQLLIAYLEILPRLSAPNYKADLRQGVAVAYVSCEPTESERELFDEDCEPGEEEQ